ncbi:MAG: peptidase M14 [Planctomycetota bacterium]
MDSPLTVDADIPAGNIIVESIDGDTVRMRPDLRDTEGHWFYWHCRVRGGAGRTVRFELTSPNTLTSRGAAASFDAGATWDRVPATGPDDFSFICRIPPGADDVRLAMTPPYAGEHLRRYLDSRDHLEVTTLCTSRKGRPVVRLRAGNLSGDAPHRVLVTARHHCCEMMASWELEGLLDAFAAADETGAWLRENVEILAVPFVDTDGVLDGDQGKRRRPRDHNRDYSDRSLYGETAAIREQVPAWSEGRLRVALDLHCPWIRGVEHNERIYIVGSSDPRNWAEQQRFGDLIERHRRGPLPYLAADNLPFGQAWNVGSNEDTGRSFGRWAATLDSVVLAASIELPYAIARETDVTADSARAFGADVATALRHYLMTL